VAAVAVAAAAFAVPGIAQAGKTVKGGGQSLKLTARFTPHRANAKHAKLKLEVTYKSTVRGQRIQTPQKELRFDLPAGTTINTSGPATCSVNQLTPSTPPYLVPSACPKASIIGGGTITADARPLISQPITGTVTLYNVRGVHYRDVAFVVKTKYDSFVYYFNVLPGRRPALRATFDKPKSGKSLYTLETVNVTLKDSSNHRSFLTTPKTCRGGHWSSAFSFATYGGQPLRATDAMPCQR
jgi:hypothetical protein